MIAVALSGGVDSAAAAVFLHEQGEAILGVTLCLDERVPDALHRERAKALCSHLNIPHHIIDVRGPFRSVKDVFCREYLAARTPNPCAMCNRDIKFGVLLDEVRSLGADRMATGHYVRKDTAYGRYYIARAQEGKSQEYFLGLLSQQALELSVFPLACVTRTEARRLAASAGLDIPEEQSSQDACFLGEEGYASFIRAHSGFTPAPGVILDVRGRVVGSHKGALNFTIGQRKGLGVGLGRRVYVLGIDSRENTITVGEPRHWRHRGFFVPEVNFMKLACLKETMAVRVKVRYRQEAQPAVIRPAGEAGVLVEHDGLFAPGQLAVFYDADDAVLCAGIIEYLPEEGRGHPRARVP